MNEKDFYQQFEGLDQHVTQLRQKLESKKLEVGSLEKTLKEHTFIQHVLTNLKSTDPKEDPGKYCPAFYFVAEINEDNIVRSATPALYKSCPSCGKGQIVLMWYEQTYDSPEGDTWEKEAFIICDNQVHTLARFTADYRF